MADENRFCASMGSDKFIAVYGNGAPLQRAAAQLSGCMSACSVHGHAHARAWSLNIPASDLKEFWGARGCTCWAM
jgi:hypothetical protein